MAKEQLHIGKKIKQVLDKSPMSVVEFAKSIHLTRNGAYKVFEKETIDTGQLQAIGKVLNHDFFAYYENVQKPRVEEHTSNYSFATKAEVEEIKVVVLKMNKSLEKLEKLMRTNTRNKK